MANQGLKVVISGDTTQLNRAFARAGAGAEQLEGRIGDASAGIGNAMKTAAKVGTVTFGVGLVGVLKESVDGFREAEKVAAQTNAVIKSTGGVANLTAKQVGDLAGALSKKSGVDDELIQSGANLLLTFTKVRNEAGKNNDVFDQTTSAALDMSVAMGTDMKSAAMQLGKALNDPEKGVTKLARSGVGFTEQQKKQISALQKSGDMLGAQKIILKEVETQFGGSAKAAGDTFAGKIGKAEVAVGNLAETIGGYVAPALADLADKGATAISSFAESGVPQRFFEGIGDRAQDAKDAIGNLFENIGDKRKGGMSTGAAIGDSIAEGVAGIDWEAIGQTLSKGISGAVKLGDQFAQGVQDGIGAALSNVNGRDMLSGLLRVVSEAINALFSPSFWIENFMAILTTVSIVIPVAKILKIPGAQFLFRFISKPFFAAINFLGRGLINLGIRAGSGFITAILQAFPRATAAIGTRLNRLGQIFTRGGRDLVGRFGAALGDLAERAGAAVARAVLAVGRGVGRMVSAGGRLAGGLIRGLANLGSSLVSTYNRALISGARRVIGWIKNFASSGRRLAAALVGGIIGGLASLPGKIKDKLKDVAGGITGAIGGFFGAGDGIGKKATPTLPSGGAPAGSLMGASSALAPLARVGSNFGLSVTSGKRAAGGRTSSGGISYHGSGEAIDMAGPPAGMLRTFQALKRAAGSRLAELIYTPGGAGIKNGRPHTYTGQVAADHFDHVHVALDLGRPGPGIGDGIGRRLVGTGDGIGRAVEAGRKAGLSGSALVTAVAIAGPESGYNPRANLVTSREDSRGLWQINTKAHPWSRTMNLYNPDVNARAMMRVSGGGRNWGPWTGYTSGAYQRFMEQARSAVVAGRGGSSSSSSSSGSSRPSAADVATKRQESAQKSGSRLINALAKKYGSGKTGFTAMSKSAERIATQIESGDTRYGQLERRFGQSEEDLGTPVGRAQRQSEISQLYKAKAAQLKRQQARAKALRLAINKLQALIRDGERARKKAKGSKRAKINERLRAFEDRLVDLQAEYRTLGFAIEDTKLDLGDLVKEAGEVAATPDTVADGLGGDSAGGAAAAAEAAAEAAAAQAQAEADAQRALKEAVDALRAEIAQQNAIAGSVMGISLREAQRALADVISGQLGGRVGQRSVIPNGDSLAVY